MKIKVLAFNLYNLEKCKGTVLYDKYIRELQYYQEINPVFNRRGLYLYGSQCWFEIEGRAFLYEKKHFLETLNLRNFEEVCDNYLQKLDDISKVYPKMLSKEEKRLLAMRKFYKPNKQQRLNEMYRKKRLQGYREEAAKKRGGV